MPKQPHSSNVSSWPSNGSQTTSPRSKGKGKSSQRRSRPQRTREKSATGSKSGRPSGAKNRNRRDELLRRLDVDVAALNAQPQIAPLLKQCGILPARVIEVLRADADDLSLAAVKLWDSLTPANRNLLGLEALAMASGMNPRRLWELYCGATMSQSRDSLGVMIADALPDIMRVTIKDAKKAKGFVSREHIFKAARVLPTPKGSVINIGVPNQGQGELEDGDEPEGKALEPADDFMMKASRAMGVKSLPEPKQTEIIDAEVVDEEEGEE